MGGTTTPQECKGDVAGMSISGSVHALVVEPTFLARVAAVIAAGSDPEVSRLVTLARGTSAVYQMQVLHGHELLYRRHHTAGWRLVVPAGCR